MHPLHAYAPVHALCTPLLSLRPQIDGFELKSAIRNSGAISGMYQGETYLLPCHTPTLPLPLP